MDRKTVVQTVHILKTVRHFARVITATMALGSLRSHLRPQIKLLDCIAPLQPFSFVLWVLCCCSLWFLTWLPARPFPSWTFAILYSFCTNTHQFYVLSVMSIKHWSYKFLLLSSGTVRFALVQVWQTAPWIVAIMCWLMKNEEQLQIHSATLNFYCYLSSLLPNS